jgi:tetratricopeptide (TPR) repeat protein
MEHIFVNELTTDKSLYIPGDKFFFEHVHLNPFGNFVTAKHLHEKVLAVLEGRGLIKTAHGSTLTFQDVSKELGLTDWDHFFMLMEIKRRTSSLPFTNRIDNQKMLAKLHRWMARLPDFEADETAKTIRAQYLHALEVRSKDWEIYHNFGRFLLIARREPKEAERYFRKAIALAPNHHPIYHNLALALTAQGRHTEAIARFEESLKKLPDQAPALHEIGKCHIALKQHKRAIVSLKRSLDIFPDAATYLSLGLAYEGLSAFEDAAESYTKALTYNPNLGEARRGLKRASGQIGKRKPIIGGNRPRGT